MIRQILAGAAVAGIAVTAAVMPANASTRVSWTHRTCAAFSAYQDRPSAARLTALVTDSTHLGRSYLKADVGELYADASSPSKAARQSLDVAEQYVGEDCYGGA